MKTTHYEISVPSIKDVTIFLLFPTSLETVHPWVVKIYKLKTEHFLNDRNKIPADYLLLCVLLVKHKHTDRTLNYVWLLPFFLRPFQGNDFSWKPRELTTSCKPCKLLTYWLASRKCTLTKSESVLHRSTLSLTINVKYNLGLQTEKEVTAFTRNLTAQIHLSDLKEPNNILFRQMWHRKMLEMVHLHFTKKFPVPEWQSLERMWQTSYFLTFLD